MAFNNGFMIKAINKPPLSEYPFSSPSTSSTSPPTSPLPYPSPSSPVLLSALPPLSAILTESTLSAPLELARQSAELQREREAAEAVVQAEREVEVRKAREEGGTWARLIAGRGGGKGKGKEKEVAKMEEWGKTKGFERMPGAYELYQAIDRKDIMFIMRVRDHAFPLLLQKNANEFPIVYASRIGKSHRDIAILIIGALSRYVNHLDDEDFQKKDTIKVLRQLRTNLKLAIDAAILPASDSTLLSSYLQVLIMSEGDQFLHKSIHTISLALRVAQDDPTSGTPVAKAEEILRGFTSKELGRWQGEGKSGVEGYVMNATADLVMMGGWGLVVDAIGGDPLPTYTFARDLRTHSLFAEALDQHQSAIASKVNKKLRGQLEIMRDVFGDSKLSVGQRVEEGKRRLDGAE